MPHIDVNGTTLYYEDTGPGQTGETIVFSHGLLLDTRLFSSQVAALRERYRCVSYDHRGQGRSAESDLRAVDIEVVYGDALALLDALDLGPVHFCGLSMGGFVALRIAARQPARLASLIVVGSSAGPEPEHNVPRYRRLNFVARYWGLRIVADRVMPIMFSRTFLEDPDRRDEVFLWRERLVANRRSIWRAVNGVLERQGVHSELGRIEVPTLIVVGEEDVATPSHDAQRMHEAIAGSQLVRIPHAGHCCTVEQPALATAAMDAFVQRRVRTRVA